MTRVIVVTLTRYQTATILPAFAQCLSILPNLHTIEIAHAHSKMMSHLKSAFEGKKFPTVRTVSLPSCAHAILRCCPAVENVTCTSGDGGTLISALAAAKCNKLTKVSGITPNTFMANREKSSFGADHLFPCNSPVIVIRRSSQSCSELKLNFYQS